VAPPDGGELGVDSPRPGDLARAVASCRARYAAAH
jgi:hypothetical protein